MNPEVNIKMKTHRFFCTSRPDFRTEAGLTLIELLVSMMIFMVVITGVAPLLISGLKTTARTRMATQGRTEAQEQIEEMRSLVYFVPFSSDVNVGSTADVDLLDKYYPNIETVMTTGSDGWQRWYTISGNDAYFTAVRPADQFGITRTVVTRFVNNAGQVIIPTSSYNSNETGFDTPPSNLVQVSVTTNWTNFGEDNSFSLSTIVSATGQVAQGGGGDDGGDGGGCGSQSSASVNITGGTFDFSTGSSGLYTPFVSGNFGEGHASFGADSCGVTMTGSGIGGTVAQAGGTTWKGAEISAMGPPDQQKIAGPVSVSQPSSWPKPSITNSKVEGEVSGNLGTKIELEGEAYVPGMSLSLQQVDTWPASLPNNYKVWDVINPVIQVTAGTEDQAEAEIVNDNGLTTGNGKISYQQINILPLQAKTTSTPSALQGLIFIRNFQATAQSQVKAQSGGATNAVTYTATIGMFNNTKASTCTGDACYTLFNISAASPFQTAINLNTAGFELQKALLTQGISFTAADITAATTASPDGLLATTSIDALLKVDLLVGTEVQMKTANKSVTLYQPQGLLKTWMGALDLTLTQGS
ncbi:MAG: prepilin-type N-terminal cleavage/methylation domain-containing protein [Thermoleophilia bacterium]